jgi:hypothetical protein
MNNAERILAELDARLNTEVELRVFIAFKGSRQKLLLGDQERSFY